MLALGEIGIDDVVVEEIGSRAWCHREQLVAGAVHENGAQRADFGGYVNWHAGRYRAEAASGNQELDLRTACQQNRIRDHSGTDRRCQFTTPGLHRPPYGRRVTVPLSR